MTTAAWISLASAIFTVAIFLGGIIFHMGKMTQRINSLEGGADGNQSTREKVIRLEERVATVQDDVTSIKRTLEGINRTLANLATKSLHFQAE